MPNLNVVILSGRLTRDPELRYTTAGIPVLEMRIANNTYHRRSDGEWTTEVAYVNVTAWQALAERTYESVGKGDAVVTTGGLISHEWKDAEGATRSMLSIRASRIQYLTREGRKEDEGDPQEAEETQEELPEEEPF